MIAPALPSSWGQGLAIKPRLVLNTQCCQLSPLKCSDCKCTLPSLAPWLTILHLTRNNPNSKGELSFICIPLSLDSLFTSILIFKMRKWSTERPVRVTHTPAYAWSHGAQDSDPESILTLEYLPGPTSLLSPCWCCLCGCQLVLLGHPKCLDPSAQCILTSSYGKKAPGCQAMIAKLHDDLTVNESETYGLNFSWTAHQDFHLIKNFESPCWKITRKKKKEEEKQSGNS